MREPFSGRWRADIMVISKCPEQLTRDEQAVIADKVSPLPYQSLFFTTVSYCSFEDRAGKRTNTTIDTDTTVFLLTGIANSRPLVQHLEKYTPKIVHHNYPDHHRFSLKNITKLADEFSACDTQKKVIITTEKDAQRLVEHERLPVLKNLPILVIPIGIQFLENGGQQFDQLVKEYVREHTANHLIH